MNLLSLAQCPYCKTSFQVENSTQLQRTGFGTVLCECERFPILESILYCKKDDILLHRQLNALIDQKRYYRAIWVALSQEKKTHRIATFLCYILRKNHVKLTESFFLRSLVLLGPSRSWFRYLLRKDRPTLETATALLSEPKHKNEVIVDVGCGWGDLASKIRKKISGSTAFLAIDKSMFSLIAAQMFHAHPNVMYICSDVEPGLPVRSLKVDHVVFLDSFMWIYSKKFLLQEAHRVLKQQRILSIVNVHSPHKTTSFLGYGISTQLLKKYLKGLFSNTILISNSLSQTKSIQPVSEIDQFGYSCQTIKN